MFDKKHKDIDWELLRTTAKIGTRFLEDVTEVTEAPLQYVNEKTKSLRKLGLGVLGFADLLVDMNIPYDSDESVELSRKLSWFIAFHAWETSFELAKERGHFSSYDKEKVNLKIIEKTLYENPYQLSAIPKEDLYNFGVRNVSVTSIAPTGSIALIGGVNGSIEPFYCLAYKRNITEGIGNIATDSLFEINPSLEEKMKEYGYSKDETLEIIKYITENGSLSDCKLVTKDVQKIFKTANEINWKRHVDIQSAWQEYVSNAISKSINIPEKSTVEEVLEIYFYMWEKRLKGGTVYRNNSKSFQILEKPNAN
jgi:ribonucleoside-diphosphate reductase alpha chain